MALARGDGQGQRSHAVIRLFRCRCGPGRPLHWFESGFGELECMGGNGEWGSVGSRVPRIISTIPPALENLSPKVRQ
jgi:hypothetical protein